MPLIYGDTGKRYIVQKISKNTQIRQHLSDLGIREGSDVKIITILSGNMILDIMGARIALGKDLVRQIMVREA